MSDSQYKQSLSDYFDGRMARGDYDSGGFHSSVARRLVDPADPRPGEQVLDIAAGSGFVTLEAARRVGPGGHVVGVDISPGMLAVAREAAAAEGLMNAEFVLGDAEAFESPAESFDLVLCCAA